MSTSIAVIDFQSILPWLNISNAELVYYIKKCFPCISLKHIHQLTDVKKFVSCDINIFHVDYYTIDIAKRVLIDVLKNSPELEIRFILYGYGVYYDDSFSSLDKRIEIFPKDNLNPIYKRIHSLLASNFIKITNNKADYSFLPIESIQNYPLRTAKGCGNSCPFCEKSLDNVHLRNIDEIEDEILIAKELYNIKALTIWDASINDSIVRFREILKLLKRIGLPWRSNGLLYKNLTNKLISEMKESGCYLTSMGVESTDITVKTGKLFDLNQYTKVCKSLRKNEILNLSFFIVGLENDNYSKSLSTIKQAENFGIDICLFTSAIAYPKTELYNHVISCGGEFIVDYRKINLQTKRVIHFDTPYFNRVEREKALLLSEKFVAENKAVRKQTEDTHGFPFTSSAKFNIKWKD